MKYEYTVFITDANTNEDMNQKATDLRSWLTENGKRAFRLHSINTSNCLHVNGNIFNMIVAVMERELKEK